MSRVGKLPLMLSLAFLTAFGVMAGIASSSFANVQCGTASWYKMGHTTANGEKYNPDGLTAAHKSLPFGTRVTVKNLRNGRSVNVRINDRGPFVKGRIIDVSRGAARKLGMIGSGTAPVQVSAAGAAGGRACG